MRQASHQRQLRGGNQLQDPREGEITILYKHSITEGFLHIEQKGNIINKISGDSVI